MVGRVLIRGKQFDDSNFINANNKNIRIFLFVVLVLAAVEVCNCFMALVCFHFLLSCTLLCNWGTWGWFGVEVLHMWVFVFSLYLNF
jgi:hypothetical protein